jgi:hypothetical protein
MSKIQPKEDIHRYASMLGIPELSHEKIKTRK